MLIVCVKEFLEFVFRFSRIFLISNTDKENAKKIFLLQKTGVCIEPGFMSPELCREYIHKIDTMISDGSVNVWQDDSAADNRIYFIDTIDSDFCDFYENKRIRSVLRDYIGIENPVGMLLAAKINFQDGNVGSGGGWHRDSPVTHQFKAVCYLNDVNNENGPFQYIKASHTKFNVIKNYVNKVFKPGQYRFTEQEVERYLQKNDAEVDSITGAAGTLVYADTKCIHRGKPVESGTRYVLFCYFWNDKIPPHFESLKQVK